jgi:UDP-N-acetylmuramyl pentapeptide phosphotransferase/UDP-N-acetylglucosamine-1-phosphate transferase
MLERMLWPATLSALGSFVLVGVVRRIAIRHEVLDHPTERSSHAVATPRGGGLALMFVALTLCVWRALQPSASLVLVPLAGATAVSVVGWLDDRRGLSVRVRLAVHVIAALGVGLLIISGDPFSWVLFGWWAFWTVTSVNLVNFMDGINGLVASQVAVFALSLALFPGVDTYAPFAAMVVAAACIGFLPWNFPRARIFLGDVGSGGLGYLVPLLALLTMRSGDVDIVRAHLPLFPLFGDAVWTIVRRWRRGERLTQPHRSHLYQRMANGGMGHTVVTALYTTAAVVGALAAHADGASGAAGALVWPVAFVAATVLGGIVLDRRVGGTARTSM